MTEGIIFHATEEARKEYEKNPIKKRKRKDDCPSCEIKIENKTDFINEEINKGDLK